MTSNRKTDPEVLEREYIFDSGNPPISFQGLADKHGLARSGVADLGVRGQWYEKRKAFRQQLGEKIVSALSDEWVEYETGVREKMMQVGLAYLDKYAEALKDDKIRVSTRDMLGIAAMIRTLIQDTTANPKVEEALIDPTNVTFGLERAREIVDDIKRIQAGQVDDDPDEAETDEPGPARRSA